GMDDLRTGVRSAAAVENAAADAAERIEARPPGRRRLGAGILRLGVLSAGKTRRLRKADIERASVRCLVRNRSFEHESVSFVLIEAELDGGAYPAAALRRTIGDRVLHSAGERVGHACAAVTQERDQIPRGREAKTHYGRIFGRVDELVNVVGIEAAIQAYLGRAGHSREWRYAAVGECELAVGDRFLWIVLMHATSQRCVGVAGADRLIRWRPCQVLRRRGRANDVLGTNASGDDT